MKSTDHAHYSAPLLCVHLCVNRAFLVEVLLRGVPNVLHCGSVSYELITREQKVIKESKLV